MVRRRLRASPDEASESGDSKFDDLRECEGFELSTGASCLQYSCCGVSIIVEEIRGYTTVQYLVLQSPEWTP